MSTDNIRVNQDKKKIILVLNPGSTSTKVALYSDDICLLERSVSHTRKELELDVFDQVGMRRQVIERLLADARISVRDLSAIAARGGRIQPVPSGVYRMNEQMIYDSINGTPGKHASALAVLIARELAADSNCPVFVVDPVSVDEFLPEARLSGLKEIERKSLGHALNSKAVALRAARNLGKSYEDVNLVIAHIGGGTTISAHRKGQMIDIINDFEGGFTPERAGGLPTIELINLCFSGRYTQEQMMRKIEGEGGFYSYLGTKDLEEIQDWIEAGDPQSILVMKAYLLQLSKSIGSLMAVLSFSVDALCITGGIACSQRVTSFLKEAFSSIAPVYIYPGSFEVETLAKRVLAVLNGEEIPKTYPGGKWNEEFFGNRECSPEKN